MTRYPISRLVQTQTISCKKNMVSILGEVKPGLFLSSPSITVVFILVVWVTFVMLQNQGIFGLGRSGKSRIWSVYPGSIPMRRRLHVYAARGYEKVSSSYLDGYSGNTNWHDTSSVNLQGNRFLWPILGSILSSFRQSTCRIWSAWTQVIWTRQGSWTT